MVEQVAIDRPFKQIRDKANFGRSFRNYRKTAQKGFGITLLLPYDLVARKRPDVSRPIEIPKRRFVGGRYDDRVVCRDEYLRGFFLKRLSS